MSAGAKDIGKETLDRIESTLGRYNTWLFEQFTPYLRGRVLEVGSGVGNLSQFLVGNDEVHLTDVSSEYLEILSRRFGELGHVRVHHWDLGAPPPPTLEPGSLDSIVCSNVVEHVEDDVAALSRMRSLLTPGGRLVLLVPAHQFLYNDFDRGLGHYRRYNRSGLRSLLTRTGYRIERIWYFNALGTLGWFVNGTLLRRTILPTGQMKLFDALVPLLKAERVLNLPFGTSVIAVASRDDV